MVSLSNHEVGNAESLASPSNARRFGILVPLQT